MPVRLRDATGADPNFERMARQRFAEEAPRGILPRTENDRVRQRLLADDKAVVIADGPKRRSWTSTSRRTGPSTSAPPAPGSTRLPDCEVQLCPYPPRGGVPRGEIREPFCRQ